MDSIIHGASVAHVHVKQTKEQEILTETVEKETLKVIPVVEKTKINWELENGK
jgi:uncharacterized protein (DUF849 family)